MYKIQFYFFLFFFYCSHQSRNLYYLGFSHPVYICFPTAFSNQVLVIMSDATKKANLKYLLFQESPAIFFPSVLENVFLVLRRA